MKIGDREISGARPPYVIAEIGVNHDGSASRALELVGLAMQAGADAVKFQYFEADRLMSRAAKLAAYQRAAGERDPVEMLRRLQLSIDELGACAAEAHRLGVHAILSVFSVELVDLARRVAWDAYKTASPDIINRPLLEALAATSRPLIVSTGASTLAEVARAAAWLAGAADRLALLQCVSAYPTPPDQMALGGIGAIRGVFAGCVGYSDHTPGTETGGEAVAAGAWMLEKHITYSRSATGPDHAASLDPRQFGRYVQGAHAAWERAREAGPIAARRAAPAPTKDVLAIEQDVRRVSRQSITSTRALPAGHHLAPGDLTIKRPGMGIPPFELGAVVGRRLARAVEGDMPLAPDDLAPGDARPQGG